MASVSAMTQKVFAYELKKLAEADPQPLYSIEAPAMEEWKDDFAGFVVKLRGPEDSPYKDGLFVFDLTLNARYPFVPPTLKLRTPIIHPAFECPDAAVAQVKSAIQQYSMGNTFGHSVTVQAVTGDSFIVERCKTLGALYDGIQDKKGVAVEQLSLVVGYTNDASQEEMMPSLTKFKGRRLPMWSNEAARSMRLEELGFGSSSLSVTMLLGSTFEGRGLAGGEGSGAFWSPGKSVADLLDIYVDLLREPLAPVPAWMAAPEEAPPSRELSAVLAGLAPKEMKWLAHTWAAQLAADPRAPPHAAETLVTQYEAQVPAATEREGSVERLSALFRVFDVDSSGELDMSELKAILTRGTTGLPPVDADEFIASFDTNKDGRISLEELCKAFTSQAGQGQGQGLH